MKIWSTIIYAKSPIDGKIKKYCGPNIKAPSKKLARVWCDNNGFGYCNIDDEIIGVDLDLQQKN